MPCKERFNDGDIIIVVGGTNVPIAEICVILEQGSPVYVNFVKYYQKIYVESLTTHKRFVTYANDILHYEPMQPEQEKRHTLVIDEDYNIIDEEED